MTPARESVPPPAMPTPPARPRPPKEVLEARLRQIAAEQGTTHSAAERLLGSGSDLWASDAELDEFLKAIRDNR